MKTVITKRKLRTHDNLTSILNGILGQKKTVGYNSDYMNKLQTLVNNNVPILVINCNRYSILTYTNNKLCVCKAGVFIWELCTNCSIFL